MAIQLHEDEEYVNPLSSKNNWSEYKKARMRELTMVCSTSEYFYATTCAFDNYREYPIMEYKTVNVELVCYHCGNQSGLMDTRGNCISCGAELETKRLDDDRNRKAKVSYVDEYEFVFEEEPKKKSWWRRLFGV